MAALPVLPRGGLHDHMTGEHADHATLLFQPGAWSVGFLGEVFVLKWIGFMLENTDPYAQGY